MTFSNVIQNIHRNSRFLLVPIILDFLTFFIALIIFRGFFGEPQFSFRVLLEMGLPSVGHLENIPLFPNKPEFLHPELPGYALFIVIALLLVRAFFQGGYIQYLTAIVKNESYSFPSFFKYSRRNFLQFILFEIIVFLFKISVASFLQVFFPGVGAFYSLIFLIFFRILYIYIEFAIVIERTSVPDAMKQSRKYLTRSFGNSISWVILLYVFTIVASIFLHKLWSPVIIIVYIIIYPYVLTLIQAGLMLNYTNTRERISRFS